MIYNSFQIHVYEYVPSMRLTKRCHYYDQEENLGCTLGDWHPLAAEKLMALALNTGNKTEVFSDGYVTIRGSPEVQCQQKIEQEQKEKEERRKKKKKGKAKGRSN